MRIAILVVPLAFVCADAAAQLAQPYRPFETQQDARDRYGAERYESYRDSGSQAPLGGYREPLGNPAPRGTPTPGYDTPPPMRPPNSYGSGSRGAPDPARPSPGYNRRSLF